MTEKQTKGNGPNDNIGLRYRNEYKRYQEDNGPEREFVVGH